MESTGFSGYTRSSISLLISKTLDTQKRGTRVFAIKKGSAAIPPSKPAPRKTTSNGQTVKLLSNVEKLRLLTKAEKAGLLSLAESLGLTLSSVERLGLLSKAEELSVLSAITDQSTPGALLTLSLVLLVLGPAFVYLVPEENALEVVLQVVVAAVSVIGGSAAFAASNFVSNLQRAS